MNDSKQRITAQVVIQTILDHAGIKRIPGSLDTCKAGDPKAEVRGIATTFLATSAVIKKAVAIGANLIITHEPTYYRHTDEIDWLKNDPVYTAKHALIDAHDIVIWRFHDHMHAGNPDLTDQGVAHVLGWTPLRDPLVEYRYQLSPTLLADFVKKVKISLDAPQARVAGRLDQTVSGVGLLVGSRNGATQIGLLSRPNIDVLICGETAEWETCEYVRDSVLTNHPKALIVVGHQKSEEPAMAWLADYIRPIFSGVPVTHIAAGDPFAVWQGSL